jgi:T5SS/PEP-CTERM-associated repeat protein
MLRSMTRNSKTDGARGSSRWLVILAALAILAALPRAATAQTGPPWPPLAGAYFWAGVDETGNGSTDDWANAWWGGRWDTAGSPPETIWLPAEDGDTLLVRSVIAGGDTNHYDIHFGSHDLPNSDILIVAHADYSGGNLTFGGIDINNHSSDGAVGYPMNFTGTTAYADTFTISDFFSPITLNEVDFFSPDMSLGGGSPMGSPSPEINFNESMVHASVLKVWQASGSMATVTLTDSSLAAADVQIGFNENELAHAAEVKLVHSNSTIHLALIIGYEGAARLSLAQESHLNAATAYVNIGDEGQGDLQISEDSEMHVRQLNIAAGHEGTVGISDGGKLYTDEATVGFLSGEGRSGTVDITGGENDSLWDVTDLIVGEFGTGFVYVRDFGILRIRGEAVLGKNEGSRGVVNLIGTQSTLDLVSGATLAIGEEGAGELHLSGGATFTSQGNTSLGKVAGGSGTVTVDSEDGPSIWTVTGSLDIGERSTGRVELTNGGKLVASGPGIFLGKQQDGEGTLVIDGDTSTVEFNGTLVMADFGKAHLELKSGATMTLDALTMATANQSMADIKLIPGEGNAHQEFTVSQDFTVGQGGNATIDVQDYSNLVTEGEVIVGDQSTSTSEVKVTGSNAFWFANDGKVTLGRAGDATLTLADGGRAVVSVDVVIAETTSSSSTLEIAPSANFGSEFSFESGTMTVGKNGTGNVNIGAGGTLSSVPSSKVVVAEANSVGTMTLTGTSGKNARFTSNGTLIVGKGVGSAGRVYVNNYGTLDLASGASPEDEHGTIIASEDGSTGRIEVRTSDVAAPVTYHPGSFVIGRGGDGTYMIRAGHHSAGSTDFYLGLQESGNGTLDIEGQGVEMDALGVYVGNTGDGELKLTDQAKLTTSAFYIARNSKATLTNSDIIATGAEAEIAGELILEPGSSFEMPSGTLKTGIAALGNLGATPEIHLTGNGESADRTRVSVQHLHIGNGVASTYVAGNSQLEVQGLLNVASSSTVLISAGTVTAGTISVGAGGTGGSFAALNGATIDTTFASGVAAFVGPGANFSIESNATAHLLGSMDISGVAKALGGGVIGASRVLIRSGGQLDVLTGSIVVGGNVHSLPTLPAGTVLVRPGGILQGVKGLSGVSAIKGKIIVGGDMIVGQSPGILTVEGDVEFQSTGRLLMEVGGLTAGDNYDQLQTTGAIAMGGVIDIQVINGAGGWTVPVEGQQFTLLSAAGGISGSFANAVGLRSITDNFRIDWGLTAGATEATATALNVALLGDFDENGTVQSADLALWRAGFGMSGSASHMQGDADGDRDVDGSDFLVWQRQLGLTATALAAAAVVPEPGCACLAAIAAGCVCGFSRQRDRSLGR